MIPWVRVRVRVSVRLGFVSIVRVRLGLLTDTHLEGVPQSVQVPVSDHRVDFPEGVDHVLVLAQ